MATYSFMVDVIPFPPRHAGNQAVGTQLAAALRSTLQRVTPTLENMPGEGQQTPGELLSHSTLQVNDQLVVMTCPPN